MTNDKPEDQQHEPEHTTTSPEIKNSENPQPIKPAAQEITVKVVQDPKEFVVNVTTPSNRTANIISAVSAGATIILLFFNFFLYHQVSKQSGYAEQSANAADSSVKISRYMTVVR